MVYLSILKYILWIVILQWYMFPLFRCPLCNYMFEIRQHMCIVLCYWNKQQSEICKCWWKLWIKNVCHFISRQKQKVTFELTKHGILGCCIIHFLIWLCQIDTWTESMLLAYQQTSLHFSRIQILCFGAFIHLFEVFYLSKMNNV